MKIGFLGWKIVLPDKNLSQFATASNLLATASYNVTESSVCSPSARHGELLCGREQCLLATASKSAREASYPVAVYLFMFLRRFHMSLFWITLVDGYLYECIYMLIKYYMNVYMFDKILYECIYIDELLYECICWLIWCYMMLLIDDEYYGIILWSHCCVVVVVVVDVVKSLMMYVDVV